MSRTRFYSAYWFAMDPTGVEPVDKILSALCLAGKGYHSTEFWNEEKGDWADYTGGSYTMWIQNAANETAEKIKQLESEKAELAQEVYELSEKLFHVLGGPSSESAWLDRISKNIIEHGEKPDGILKKE